MSNNYTKEQVELMQAKAIVELHEWSIEPGEMHENNKTIEKMSQIASTCDSNKYEFITLNQLIVINRS